MNRLERLYQPQLQQLGAYITTKDDSRCFALFDNDLCEGTFLAIKADDGCLITRFEVLIKEDFILSEHYEECLCIMSRSPSVANEELKDAFDDNLDAPNAITVFTHQGGDTPRRLHSGTGYEATTIFYLKEYFDHIDVPHLGSLDEISRMVPSLNSELVSLHLRALIDDLDPAAARKPSGTYYYRAHALQALCLVMDMLFELGRLKEMGIEGDDLRLVREVMEIIDTSLEHVPTIRQLAEQLYVGHTHLCSTFKAATGLTIGEYSRKRKMETSRVLLRDPDIPIKEISEMMGFKTVAGFANSFRRMIGVTPKQYRLAITQ